MKKDKDQLPTFTRQREFQYTQSFKEKTMQTKFFPEYPKSNNVSKIFFNQPYLNTNL